jgi:hypothetical protein
MVGGTALGQCPFTVSMWSSFLAGQPTASGMKQTAGDAFGFRRDGVTGPLLTSLRNSESIPFSWGDPTQPYNVPQAGPIFSSAPAFSQNPFYDRTPGFTGIMMHPGYGSITCTAVFTADHAMTVTGVHLLTELLGHTSNGTVATLQLVTAGGATTTLAGPVLSQWGESFVDTAVTPPTPFALQPGDRFVVTTGNNGDPGQDWLNVNLNINILGEPVVTAQPRGVAVCPGLGAMMKVTAEGASGYQWQRETADLPGQTAPTLVLNNLVGDDSGRYRCIVTNACGSTASRYGTLLVRTADVGQQGGIGGGDEMLDNNDFVVFIDRFFAGDARADYGAQGGLPGPDGTFDNNDFIVFIDLFFSGCQ